MRRVLALLAGGLIALVMAPPALAQEDPASRSPISGHFVSDDPFDPLVEDEVPVANEPVTTTIVDTNTGDGQVDLQPNGGTIDVQPNGTVDVLPNTGADPSSYVVIAYGVIAAGLAALVLARTFASNRI